MKNKKTIKKIISLFIVMSLSMTSFAAVVSDNDGSAFITKSEFDSLKNDFQSQLDSYNTGIDSKIDSAISSYLAGINKNNSASDLISLSILFPDKYLLMNFLTADAKITLVIKIFLSFFLSSKYLFI